MRAHSALALSDLGPDGFTIASTNESSARIVRLDVDDEALRAAIPLLSVQHGETVLPEPLEQHEAAWSMLDVHLQGTVQSMPSQVTALRLRPEGSLQLCA
jgi:hypothetical protein